MPMQISPHPFRLSEKQTKTFCRYPKHFVIAQPSRYIMQTKSVTFPILCFLFAHIPSSQPIIHHIHVVFKSYVVKKIPSSTPPNHLHPRTVTAYYSPLEYLQNCLHLSPYLNTTTLIGANTKLIAPNTINPQPYPKESTSGAVVNGKKVPIRHLLTITPVMALAENKPKASTTYAISGMSVNMTLAPISPQAMSKKGRGRRSWATQP